MEEQRRKEEVLEHLERSKPQRSVTGKQPMGEETPVLFHTVSSASCWLKSTLPSPPTPGDLALLQADFLQPPGAFRLSLFRARASGVLIAVWWGAFADGEQSLRLAPPAGLCKQC